MESFQARGFGEEWKFEGRASSSNQSWNHLRNPGRGLWLCTTAGPGPQEVLDQAKRLPGNASKFGGSGRSFALEEASARVAATLRRRRCG